LRPDLVDLSFSRPSKPPGLQFHFVNRLTTATYGISFAYGSAVIYGRDAAAAASSTGAYTYSSARMIDAWSDGTYWYIQY
jgi:hypothetical protein